MENTRPTGGRPDLPLEQQSVRRITIRFTNEEFRMVTARRETVQSKDMSDFIRSVILNKPLPVREALTTYQNTVLSQLGEIRDDILRIGVNVNQSAKRINSTTDYRDLQRETGSLSEQVRSMHDQLNALIIQLMTLDKDTDGRPNQ